MTDSTPSLEPNAACLARIADLHPPDRPTRVSLYRRDALLQFEADAALLAGLQPHAWVTLTVDPQGALSSITPVPDSVPVSTHADGDALRWNQPRGGRATRMEFLRRRHRILQAIRAWFDAEGFLEVETPTLVRAPSPEPIFSPLPVRPAAPEADRAGGWLITSPEYQLKRLLVGGFERIYRMGPVFRGAEVGAHHNPEFTLLEWYRTVPGADPAQMSPVLGDDLESLLGALVPQMLEALGDSPAVAGLHALAEALLRRPWRRVTVRELFRELLKMDIGGRRDGAGLRAAAAAAAVPGASALPDDFTEAFTALWLQVEDRMRSSFGVAPVLVEEWPAPLASLARLKPGDPTVALRTELYAGGLELANGFVELTDATEQRRRFAADLAARTDRSLPAVPLDEAFLRALEEGLPPSVGMALGVDRLVMLLTGADQIAEVLPFAWDER